MNNICLAGIIGTTLVVGAIGTIIYLRHRNTIFPVKIEQIEGDLQFEDIVSYFRNLNLEKGGHVPFIARADSDEFKKISRGTITDKEGYKALLLGVFTQKNDKICHAKVVYSKGWSDNIIATMGDELLVVLS